jgi:hypothetical protein
MKYCKYCGKPIVRLKKNCDTCSNDCPEKGVHFSIIKQLRESGNEKKLENESQRR